MGRYSEFAGLAPLSQPDPAILDHLLMLRLVGVGFLGQAESLLAQGFGASVVLDHLLGQEVDPRQKLKVALALIDVLMPLPIVAWHLDMHGIHPASLAFAQRASHVKEYLQRLLLRGRFSEWKFSERQRNWRGQVEVEADPSLGTFPQGLVIPEWELCISRNPHVKDLGLKMVVSSLWVEGCPNLRSIVLEEPAKFGSYGLDECPAVILEQCPSLESLKWFGPLREFVLFECGGAFIRGDPINARSVLIRSCPRLEVLPEVASAKDEMILVDLPRLRKIPKGLSLGGDLRVLSCHRLESLPEDLEVPGDLILEDLPSLRGLPKRLNVGGTIRVQGCPRPRTKTK